MFSTNALKGLCHASPLTKLPASSFLVPQMSGFLGKVAQRFPGFVRTEARISKPDMTMEELRKVRSSLTFLPHPSMT